MIAAVEAAPLDEDGLPRPIAYTDLAEKIYGVENPTRAQVESVGRACRRLVDREEVLKRDVRGRSRQLEGAVSRRFTFRERSLEARIRGEREARSAEALAELRAALHNLGA